MDNLSMSFRLKNIVFEKDYLKLTDSKEGKYQISYEELVFVYLEAYSAESGEKSRLIRPALEDITEDMDGELVMLDCRHCRWKLKTDLSGKKAGAIMIELGIHAPYILLGSQAWLDENEEDDLIRLRRWCRLCENVKVQHNDNGNGSRIGIVAYCEKFSISKKVLT